MKYNQPYGISDPDGPYINGNPSTGTMGSIPPAASIEFPQREIVNLIAAAGLVVPDNADLRQLARSVQSQLLFSDDDVGTANQYQVTQAPVPTGYFKYMTVVTQIANTNTAASTLNVNALGAKPIVRIDGTALNPGDLVQGTIVCLIYDGAKFQIVWSSLSKGGSQSILTQQTTIFINVVTGSDTLYDGSSATVVAGTVKGPFKTIQHGVDVAQKFQPSPLFGVTIQIADGTYPESVHTASIPGPALTVNGNAAAPANVTIDASGKGNCFSVNGPNVVYLQNLRFTTNIVNAAGVGANGSGANLITMNTVSLGVPTWCFLANGLGAVGIGNHIFGGNTGYPFAAYRNGAINLGGSAQFTIQSPISVGAFAMCVSGGQIEVPGTGIPIFVSPGNVSGAKYSASLNGVINTQGAGVNYFPGSVAGSLASGGQYG